MSHFETGHSESVIYLYNWEILTIRCYAPFIREKMDLAAIITRLSSMTGVLPPGTDKLIELLRTYPKSSVAVSAIIVIGTLWVSK